MTRVELGARSQGVLARAEPRELRDVGAGDERLAAGAAEHEHAEAGVRVHALAGVDERFVHVPGHGVARLGTVDGQERERRSVGRVDVEQDCAGWTRDGSSGVESADGRSMGFACWTSRR